MQHSPTRLYPISPLQPPFPMSLYYPTHTLMRPSITHIRPSSFIAPMLLTAAFLGSMLVTGGNEQ